MEYNVSHLPHSLLFPPLTSYPFFIPLINKTIHVSFYMMDFKLIEAFTQSDNVRYYTIEKVASILIYFDNRSDHHH